MIEVTVPRNGLREIEEVEGALKAALGVKYVGMSLRKQDAIIHLIDSATGDDRLLAATTYAGALAAIDPKQPPPSQQRAHKRENARKDVALVDFTDLKQRAAAANSVVALRAEVEALAQVVEQLAETQGLRE